MAREVTRTASPLSSTPPSSWSQGGAEWVAKRGRTHSVAHHSGSPFASDRGYGWRRRASVLTAWSGESRSRPKQRKRPDRPRARRAVGRAARARVHAAAGRESAHILLHVKRSAKHTHADDTETMPSRQPVEGVCGAGKKHGAVRARLVLLEAGYERLLLLFGRRTDVRDRGEAVECNFGMRPTTRHPPPLHSTVTASWPPSMARQKGGKSLKKRQSKGESVARKERVSNPGCACGSRTSAWRAGSAPTGEAAASGQQVLLGFRHHPPGSLTPRRLQSANIDTRGPARLADLHVTHACPSSPASPSPKSPFTEVIPSALRRTPARKHATVVHDL